MCRKWRGWLLAFAVVLSGPATAAATAAEANAEANATPPVLPDRPEAELFNDVPAPWRAYLLAARRAERIEDPLQRCLAYPDLPGNQWPAGHAADHCRGHHAPSPLPVDALNRLLDEGQFDAAQLRLDALLRQHFSKSDFNEGIDFAFDGFSATNPEVDARTQHWLQARPDSAYAHLARGVYLLFAGIEARGSGFIRNTPASKLRDMEDLIARAVPELQLATRMQPKLMPAYAMQVLAAMYDSSALDVATVIQAAGRQDPACQTMYLRRMDALRPRWGGSYVAMLALAGEIQDHVGMRPQIAIYLGQPYAERGRMLMDADDYGHEVVELLDLAVRKGSLEEALSTAADAAFNANDASRDPWKGLAYLLQEARFRDGGRWADVNIARMLVRVEPVLAWRYAHRVLVWKPEDAGANFYFAAANHNIGRFEVADRHYRLAMEDHDFLEDSLDELISMWLFRSGLPRPEAAAKVAPDIERMLREFPDDGRARMYRIETGRYVGGVIKAEWVRDFLDKMDPKDPVQAGYRRFLDAWFAKAPGLREMVYRTGPAGKK